MTFVYSDFNNRFVVTHLEPEQRLSRRDEVQGSDPTCDQPTRTSASFLLLWSVFFEPFIIVILVVISGIFRFYCYDVSRYLLICWLELSLKNTSFKGECC